MKCFCKDGCQLAADPRNYLIEVDGQRIHFEMHRWFGPAVLNAAGDPARNQPGPRHKFWTAVTRWSQQGRRVGEDGLCIWGVPAEPELVHIGGRNYAIKDSALAMKYGRQPC